MHVLKHQLYLLESFEIWSTIILDLH